MDEKYYKLEIRLFDLNGECTYWGNGNIILIPKEGLAEGYIANDYVFVEFGEDITYFDLINWDDGYGISLECNTYLLEIPGISDIKVEDFGQISILANTEINDVIEFQRIKERVKEVRNMCKY